MAHLAGTAMPTTLHEWLTWEFWRWDSASSTTGDWAYRGFNLLEAVVWLALGALVLRRWIRHRRAGSEVAYAAAFAVFGGTDIVEAWLLQPWLILVKGLVLLVLVLLRRHVIKSYYPHSRTF